MNTSFILDGPPCGAEFRDNGLRPAWTAATDKLLAFRPC